MLLFLVNKKNKIKVRKISNKIFMKIISLRCETALKKVLEHAKTNSTLPSS